MRNHITAPAMLLSALILSACTTTPPTTLSTFKPFNGKVLIEGLTAWDMAIDKNQMLWISERADGVLSTIDPITAKRTIIHRFDDVVADSPQQGFMGFTLADKFLAGDNVIYAAYSYADDNKQAWTKIVRLTLNDSADKVIKTDIILDKLHSYTDHQGGRLRLGADGKLYYSIGDLGRNQYAKTCEPIQAQRLPTQNELAHQDYSAYQGKILRLNTDGSIPDDNPVLNGVKSHVYSYGHRTRKA